MHKNEGWVNPDNVEEPLPDYCHDLNAIWDAKEKLGLHNRDNVEPTGTVGEYPQDGGGQGLAEE